MKYSDDEIIKALTIYGASLDDCYLFAVTGATSCGFYLRDIDELRLNIIENDELFVSACDFLQKRGKNIVISIEEEQAFLEERRRFYEKLERSKR